MKRVVVTSKLHEEDIRPPQLLSEFKRLSVEDAGRFFGDAGALVAVDKIEKLEKTADGRTLVMLRNTTPDEDNTPDDELVVSRRHLATVRRRLKGG